MAHDIRADNPSCHLFEMTSEAFFAAHNRAALSGGAIDLAFIDGMHHFEFMLRDFMNIEPHCRPERLSLELRWRRIRQSC